MLLKHDDKLEWTMIIIERSTGAEIIVSFSRPTLLYLYECLLWWRLSLYECLLWWRLSLYECLLWWRLSLYEHLLWWRLGLYERACCYGDSVYVSAGVEIKLLCECVCGGDSAYM